MRLDQPILVRVAGGLGNQMFHYALARSLLARTGAAVRLEVPIGYRRSDVPDGMPGALSCGHRRLGLLDWRISPDVVIEFVDGGDRAMDAGLVGVASAAVAAEQVDRGDRGRDASGQATHGLVVERRRRWVVEAFDAVPGSDLRGYWQNERYFTPVAAALRAEFQLASPTVAELRRVEHIEGAGITVGVHVRRGDYVSRHSAPIHDVCTPAYFRQAVNAVRQRAAIEIERAFVFSDDPDWARRHLRLGLPTEVLEPGERASGDLWAMSRCTHHVIANSTYSWWAAWLADDRPGHLVVAPQPWFADGRGSEIVPERWATIRVRVLPRPLRRLARVLSRLAPRW